MPGDLLKSHDGQVIAVESLQDTQRDVTLYNMRIEEYHTYFVGCADWGFSVWAHNADYLPSNARTADIDEVYRRLETYHGVDTNTASELLHQGKEALGYAPDADLVFDLTGNVYDSNSLEWLFQLVNPRY